MVCNSNLAFNEIVRMETSIQHFSRVATRDVELGQGAVIRAGQRALISYAPAKAWHVRVLAGLTDVKFAALVPENFACKSVQTSWEISTFAVPVLSAAVPAAGPVPSGCVRPR